MLHFILQFLPYDPFGKDCMLYSVKNVVEDHPEIEYNDGIRKLFLYTGGKKGGTKALKNLLISGTQYRRKCR